MAFSGDALERVSGGNTDAGSLWKYKEAATRAAIRASGYFNNAVDYGLSDGDIVIMYGSDGFGLSLISGSGSTYTVGEGLTSA